MTVFVVECGVCATFPCAWAFVLLITGALRAAAETNTAQASSLGVTTTQRALSTSSVIGASSQPDTNKNKLLVATAAASPAHRAAGPGRAGAQAARRCTERAGSCTRWRRRAPPRRRTASSVRPAPAALLVSGERVGCAPRERPRSASPQSPPGRLPWILGRCMGGWLNAIGRGLGLQRSPLLVSRQRLVHGAELDAAPGSWRALFCSGAGRDPARSASGLERRVLAELWRLGALLKI
jgi:hypothetical protein